MDLIPEQIVYSMLMLSAYHVQGTCLDRKTDTDSSPLQIMCLFEFHYNEIIMKRSTGFHGMCG